MMLSLIIPAYNEAAIISNTLDTLTKYLSKKFNSYEIIVVNDGSMDETGQKVSEYISLNKANQIFQITNGSNKGKGYSVRSGMMTAKGEVLIFMDADLAFDLDNIMPIYTRVTQGVPIVIGSRNLPQSRVIARIPLMRLISGKIFSLLTQLLVFKGITDTQCGIKGFSKNAASTIFPLSRLNDFGFDVEILFIAKKFGYKIEPLPVTMVDNRLDSRINLVSDSFKMLMDLFIIRWNDIIGVYRPNIRK